MKATWQCFGHDHYGLVAEDGRIIAEVTESWPPTTYTYNGVKYFTKMHAMKAAEKHVCAEVDET
jgi:hypothetical protein